MCSLDEVEFKVFVEKFPAAEISVPDCAEILRHTKSMVCLSERRLMRVMTSVRQYSFSLEKHVMAACAELQRENGKVKRSCQAARPSCPPYWLMFCGSPWEELEPRPRSLSLSAADARKPRPPRAVQFLDESSSSAAQVRPKSSSRAPLRRGPRGSAPHVRSSSASSVKDKHPSPQGSPHGPRAPRRKSSRCGRAPRAPPLPRPASAGPLPSARTPRPSAQAARPRTSGGSQDAGAELLCALSQEERELLEAVTRHGYTLHAAIMALQRTGPRSPEQILSYLRSCERLCGLGHDKTQVEEALEMFQNCESKAAEFLLLLAQFCEMGFQTSAIKEVLLVHENHRERALDELMSRSC